MNNSTIFFFLAVFFGSHFCIAQNSEYFFKTIPTITSSTPDWAQKMYADHPNVREVDWEYYQFYKENSFEKNIHTQNYKFWRRNIDAYLDQEGFIDQALIKKEHIFLKNKQRRNEEYAFARSNNWECIGPMETFNLASQGGFPVSWQANVYAFDQSVSDPDILFAGTESGGVFKSADKGLNWTSVSLNEPFITVNDVKIAPSNSNIVYIIAQSIIYKSSDGGNTWAEVYDIDGSGYNLAVHPTNPDIVFCANEFGLLQTIDGGNNWTNSFSSKCWDISFHPSNPSVLFLLKN